MVNNINYEGVPAVFNPALNPKSFIGYTGIVVSDDLSPLVRGGLYGSCGQVALKAIDAGVDILIFSGASNAGCAIEEISKMANEGKLNDSTKTKITEAAKKSS